MEQVQTLAPHFRMASDRNVPGATSPMGIARDFLGSITKCDGDSYKDKPLSELKMELDHNNTKEVVTVDKSSGVKTAMELTCKNDMVIASETETLCSSSVAPTSGCANDTGGFATYTTKKLSAKSREVKLVPISNDEPTDSPISFASDSAAAAALPTEDVTTAVCPIKIEANSSDEEIDLLSHDDSPMVQCEVDPLSVSPGGLNSASDFLQKLVQEQKSQVPTLFCRQLPVLHDASKVYNTMDIKPCAKLHSSMHVPNVSVVMSAGSHATKKCDSSISTSIAKNLSIYSESSAHLNDLSMWKGEKSEKYVSKYENISSDDDVKPSRRKIPSSISAASGSITDSNGKLRFYLDGRFVLELMHASGDQGNSSGWVQSKGKIWTPLSHTSGVSSRTSGKKTIAASSNSQVTKTTLVDFPSPANTVSSLFMLRTSKLTRTTYLCWLSRKEFKRGARNPSRNLHTLYQSALQRNQPIISPSVKEVQKKNCTFRRRKTLNELWKTLQNQRRSFNRSSSPMNQESASEPGNKDLALSKTNRSLLLSALTKPKLRDNRLLDVPSDNSTHTMANPGAKEWHEALKTSSPMTMLDMGWNESDVSSAANHIEYKLANKSAAASADSNSSLMSAAVSTESMPKTCKSESVPLSSLLPLPEWYLDPSKAEVPISEMIGYPRPYFPSVSSENRLHSNKKRYQESLHATYPNSLLSKKLRLKDEDANKNNCLKSSTCTSPLEINELPDARTEQWHKWDPQTECASDASSLNLASIPPSSADDNSSNGESLENRLLNNACDINQKIRCAKRFGSYGRGHAVNEAIRTFVISDIVNLGGDVESRYVPRGVYSEMASRYKIDVSTTTRWWLRYCADFEQASKRTSISVSHSDKTNPSDDFHFPQTKELNDTYPSLSSAPIINLKKELSPGQIKKPVVLKKLYISSLNRDSSSPKISSESNDSVDFPFHKDKDSDFQNRLPSTHFNSFHNDDGLRGPLDRRLQQSYREKTESLDAPLDLRVKRTKIEDSQEDVQPIARASISPPSYHMASMASTMYNVPQDLTLKIDRTEECFNSFHYNKKKIASDAKAIGYVNSYSKTTSSENVLGPSKSWSTTNGQNKMDEVGLTRPLSTKQDEMHCNGRLSSSSSEMSSNANVSPVLMSSIHHQDFKEDLRNHVSVMSTPCTNSGKSSTSASSLSDFLLQSKDAKPAAPATTCYLGSAEHHGGSASHGCQKNPKGHAVEAATRIHSSPEIKSASCNSDVGVKPKSMCAGFSSADKTVTGKYPTLGVPLPSLNPNYAGLVPPPPPSIAALGSWPYSQCAPFMTCAPALINSYYYCCCFLPGCRFPYAYSPDGQSVEGGGALTASPLLIANGFSKYCPSVADVSPVMYESVHPEHMYKSWESPVTDSKLTDKAIPSLPKETSESPDNVHENTSQTNSETTGSMLKDLLLKPSRPISEHSPDPPNHSNKSTLPELATSPRLNSVFDRGSQKLSEQEAIPSSGIKMHSSSEDHNSEGAFQMHSEYDAKVNSFSNQTESAEQILDYTKGISCESAASSLENDAEDASASRSETEASKDTEASVSVSD